MNPLTDKLLPKSNLGYLTFYRGNVGTYKYRSVCASNSTPLYKYWNVICSYLETVHIRIASSRELHKRLV